MSESAIDHADLPVIADATLPAKYEQAKTALAECSRVDECQEWADRSAALASYARQAGDETLRRHATRIQARAISRCSELLRMIEKQHGANQNISDGAVTKVTRTAVAAAAGLSERQRVTAMRVGNVPRDEFERLVESDDPPSITALAELGRKPLIDLGGRLPQDVSAATEALGALRRFAEMTETITPEQAAAGILSDRARREAAAHVRAADAWLDRFIVMTGPATTPARVD